MRMSKVPSTDCPMAYVSVRIAKSHDRQDDTPVGFIATAKKD